MKSFPKTISGSASVAHRATWRSPSFGVRVAGFALAVLMGAVLIAGIDANIWSEQARLQEGFAAIKAEKFYFGVNFRLSLRKLTETLLDYQLTHNPQDLKTFQQDAHALKLWLDSRQGSFLGPGEDPTFARLQTAYTGFLEQVSPFLRTSGAPVRERFGDTYAIIRRDSQPVFQACEDVVQVQHRQFDVFVRDSDHAMLSLQRLFLLSLVLLVGLAGTVAVLVYRGMLAPLRAQLTQSKALIERQEKLASLGALGAGVAHEIRNPLTAIKFRLFSLRKSLPQEFAQNEDARVISEELNRLDRIVKDFLQFARPSEPELVRVPAERILDEVYSLMKPELEPAAIELKRDIRQPVWIQADIQQLKQVLINLVQNSADSIGRHGSITLRLTQANGDDGSRPTAILAVADTGRGIPPAVQKRLFDPFFTTKEGGTGLGLAIAARIVEKHGGLLRYQTELNRGTLFEIVLPGLKDHASKDTAR
ncbi:MAG TPA: ATP-binding protein [Verrucomicrobiae bacterium]|nr:ATP-binding protein [Verrucomicrobiae bacterium]